VYDNWKLGGKMEVRVRTMMLSSLLAAGACQAGLAQTPPRSRMEEQLAQESRTAQLVHEGYKLTAEQAASLETALAQAPGDLNLRGKLLGYYFSPASQSLGPQARIQARRTHILWLIRNHPDSALLTTSESTIDSHGNPLADAVGYQEARKAWLEQTAKSDATVAVLAGEARFFFLPDKALAAQFYARASKLEPDNQMWVAKQGSVMAFAIAGVTGMNQNGFPDVADAAEAGSAYAISARRELETSKDAPLILAAAGELMWRGSMAQTMARQTGRALPVDALQLAETLLKHLQELEPGKPDSSLGLARIYELRGMSATSPAEKKALAQARYEQLVKAVGALPPADPHNSSQLLVLAGAALDVGELQRAQSIAQQLLELVPKLKADPRLSWSVDGVVHHSQLILGRVALRQGNLEAAKAHLLDAARVSGGGSLSSFGPNMTLAKELLEKGESAAVLEYFELCRKFWSFSNRLDPWIDAIHKGQMPNFGANLNY
jgi:hypothetical protein